REALPQEGLAARQPELPEWRRSFGNPVDLLVRQVVFAVQLVEIKTGAAQRIAARRDEQEQRVELPAAYAVLHDRKIVILFHVKQRNSFTFYSRRNTTCLTQYIHIWPLTCNFPRGGFMSFGLYLLGYIVLIIGLA